MGQKVNPLIFRQSITKPEVSTWVSNRDKFFHLQHQDLEIRNFLSELLRSRGILLRSCKVIRSSQRLRLELDFYFSQILAKQSKFFWARAMFRTIKKKYVNLSKIRDLKNFIEEIEAGEHEEDALSHYYVNSSKKNYTLSYLKRRKYFLQQKKRKKNFVFKTSVLTYKHRFLFFLKFKKNKNQVILKKEGFSVFSSVKNSLKPHIYRFRLSKLKKLFFINKFNYTFQKFNLESSFSSRKKDKKGLLTLNQALCQSLHHFTGFEVLELKIYSNQLNYLPSLKLHQNILKEKLFLFYRNRDLKKYYFEFVETFYFVLGTFGFGNAYLLSKLVSYMIENNRKHTLIARFLKKSLQVFFTNLSDNFLAVDGIKILIKGRFNKRRRTKTIVVQQGQISLQTIGTPIDYHQTQAITIYGTFGIKIWLAKKFVA